MTESGLNEFDSTPSFIQNVNTTVTLAPVPVAVLEQTELDKVEAAALSVVQSIEEKMELVSDVVAEGHYLAPAPKNIHVHIAAGGGSVIRNPG